MKRKEFLKLSSLTGASLLLPYNPLLSSCNGIKTVEHSTEFRNLVYGLLKDWCDGLMRTQVFDEAIQKFMHVQVPADTKVHGRMMDAVYPLLPWPNIQEKKSIRNLELP